MAQARTGGWARLWASLWRRFLRVWPVLWRWFLWTVCLAGLFPIGLLAVVEFGVTQRWPSGVELVGRGDLFLIASILLLGSLPDLFRLEKRRGVDEAILWLVIATSAFGLVAWSVVAAEATAHGKFKAAWFPTWVGMGFLIVALGIVGMTMWVQVRAEPPEVGEAGNGDD